MYENSFLQIKTHGGQYYINIQEYHTHRDFFSTIIENVFSFSGITSKRTKKFTQVMVPADKIISLEDLLKSKKMTPEYYKLLFKSLAEQLYRLQSKNLTILQYNVKDILMFKFIDTTIFYYLNPDDVFKTNMERIIIDSPFKMTNFIAPELATIKIIPNNKHNKTASFWSLAALITYCLSRTYKIKVPKTQNDFNNVLEKIKYSKLYWALKRCFKKNPSHREMIYI